MVNGNQFGAKTLSQGVTQGENKTLSRFSSLRVFKSFSQLR
jgi:hypothetical protein